MIVKNCKIGGMRRKILFTLIVMFAFNGITLANIVDVQISPVIPKISDEITINIFGREGSGPVSIDGSYFERQGTILQLDIFLNVGFFAVMTPWSHSQNIGTLPAGTYNLTVKTYELPNLTNTYSTSFEVVPEPSTILLLALGALGILLKYHNKK